MCKKLYELSSFTPPQGLRDGAIHSEGLWTGHTAKAILTENHIGVYLTQCSALNLGKKPVDVLDQVILCHCERKGRALTVSLISTHWVPLVPFTVVMTTKTNNAVTSLDVRKSPLKGNIVSVWDYSDKV